MQCVSLVIFLLFGGILHGDALSAALEMEKSGQKEQAIDLYGQWLTENSSSDPEASGVLMHGALLFKDPLKAISWLTRYVGELPLGSRGEIFALAAEWETALGLLKHAIDHLSLAIQSGGEDVDNWSLRRLVLLHSMGENVREQALHLKKTARDRKVAAEAGLLAVLDLAQIEGPKKAVTELRRLIQTGPVLPTMWLELARLESAAGNPAGQQEAIHRLEKDFPDSVQQYAAQSRILSWETPLTLMGSSSTLPGPIQVGAFGRKKYAADMRKRLEADGFTAWIEYIDGYWKVIVNDPDGETSGRLKSMG